MTSQAALEVEVANGIVQDFVLDPSLGLNTVAMRSADASMLRSVEATIEAVRPEDVQFGLEDEGGL
jgi:hypothetical protein